ncbi:MAG: ribonuclease HII [Microbacteriaceae bacterium]|nr:ribonuclease HII [Microbacteriaceae bacterium]
MDEVGRGAVAGPVAVGVVALDPLAVVVPDGLRDSKLLSEPRREALHPVVSVWGTARAVGLASSEEVDAFGIVVALGLAGARALGSLRAEGVLLAASIVLLDGSHDWLSRALEERTAVRTRVKADRDCASVAGASVLAKVHRDRLMATSDIEHPGYGWARNKGYGAPEHLEAVRTAGLSPLHRRSFLSRLEPEPAGGPGLRST